MPVAADFAFPGGSAIDVVNIRTGGETSRQLSLTLPSNTRLGDGGIIQLTIKPIDPDKIQARVRINNVDVFSFGPTSSALTRSFHDPFQIQGLRVGNNTIQFAIVGGTGQLLISDTVIWYKVDA